MAMAASTSSAANNWQADFLSALAERDKREHAFDDICAAYTRLAERATTTTTAAAAPVAAAPADPSASASSSASGSTTNPELSALKHDLSQAQTQQAALTAQVRALTASSAALQSELESARTKLEAVERERTRWERRARDLEAEIRGKDKVIQNVQDEMLALNMECNMAVQREKETRKENEMLLERWMKLKGRQAEEMNRAFE